MNGEEVIVAHFRNNYQLTKKSYRDLNRVPGEC